MHQSNRIQNANVCTKSIDNVRNPNNERKIGSDNPQAPSGLVVVQKRNANAMRYQPKKDRTRGELRKRETQEEKERKKKG
jgi:hypothetical protein